MHPCYAMHRTMKGRANKSRSVAALFMRLTKYRSGTSFGSSSASRQLCCWPLKLSKRGKLRHKQVERAMKAFWRQPMLRACVCVYILYIIYIYNIIFVHIHLLLSSVLFYREIEIPVKTKWRLDLVGTENEKKKLKSEQL